MKASSSVTVTVVSLLSLLAGCAPAASSLQLRSARQLGCTPAQKLKLSGYTPGEPRRNQPERWKVTGCGVTYSCASFLMASGDPAHTECVEERTKGPQQRLTDAQRHQISVRLKRVSLQQVADSSGCAPTEVRIKGELVQGTAYIHMVQGCGQAFRCLTLGAGSLLESTTQCDALAKEL